MNTYYFMKKQLRYSVRLYVEQNWKISTVCKQLCSGTLPLGTGTLPCFLMVPWREDFVLWLRWHWKQSALIVWLLTMWCKDYTFQQNVLKVWWVLVFSVTVCKVPSYGGGYVLVWETFHQCNSFFLPYKSVWAVHLCWRHIPQIQTLNRK